MLNINAKKLKIANTNTKSELNFKTFQIKYLFKYKLILSLKLLKI